MEGVFNEVPPGVQGLEHNLLGPATPFFMPSRGFSGPGAPLASSWDCSWTLVWAFDHSVIWVQTKYEMDFVGGVVHHSCCYCWGALRVPVVDTFSSPSCSLTQWKELVVLKIFLCLLLISSAHIWAILWVCMCLLMFWCFAPFGDFYRSHIIDQPLGRRFSLKFKYHKKAHFFSAMNVKRAHVCSRSSTSICPVLNCVVSEKISN